MIIHPLFIRSFSNNAKKSVAQLVFLLLASSLLASPLLASPLLASPLLASSATRSAHALADDHSSANKDILISSGHSSLPQHYPVKSRYTIDAQSELVIHGSNHDSQPRIVIIRFDDHLSSNYHSQVNIERKVMPGPFTIYQPLFGLKTGEKRLFNWQQWQKFILFSDKSDSDNNANITVKRVAINHIASFSNASFGFDLGAKHSPVLPGMKQITPAYPGISGKHLRARDHVSGNALITDGIQGIDSLSIPLDNGRWDVTLWFFMEGEWENLPRQHRQHIRLQGKTIWQRDLSPQQWIKNDYLRGQDPEAWFDGSPWQLFGDRPGQRITRTAVIDNGRLQLTFNGASVHDNYLAGIFVSPSSLQGKDTDALHQATRTRFKQKWQLGNQPPESIGPVEPGLPTVTLQQVYFTPQWRPDLPRVPRETPVTVARNSHAVIDFALDSSRPLDDLQVRLLLRHDSDNGSRPVSLPVEMRQGFWRYRRADGASTLLTLNADELQPLKPGQALRTGNHLSRRINLRIPVDDAVLGKLKNAKAADKAAQKVFGELQIYQGQRQLASHTFELDILNMQLPRMRQAVGIYHEKAVHWLWFGNLQHHAQKTLACDQHYLGALGLTALSPPLSTPKAIKAQQSNEQINATIEPYITDLQSYQRYFKHAAIDYTTVKRLAARYRRHPDLQVRHLAYLSREIDAHGLTLPQFAIADEVPLLNPRQLGEFSQSIALLQNAMPSATFVGQLNKPANRQLIPMLDTLLINHGFGVSKKNITELQRQGKSVWLYNMGKRRLAAGFYLWQSQAQGYLQWHGRMPTGDPYNPLDGRETDFQLFYPTLQSCVDVPAINAQLLGIAAGIQDRQWLNWLIKTAATEPRAKQLLKTLKAAIPTVWEQAETLPEQQLHRWRKAITDLAQSLLLMKTSDKATKDTQ